MFPHLVKSPAWINMSPFGICRFMWDVSECVSLRQTTRICKDTRSLMFRLLMHSLLRNKPFVPNKCRIV